MPSDIRATHRAAAANFQTSSRSCSKAIMATSALRITRSEEHTSELQSRGHLVCRLLLEKKKKNTRKEKDNTIEQMIISHQHQALERECTKAAEDEQR